MSNKGFGDTISTLIKTASRGKIKECGGCKKRKEWLNRNVPYGNDFYSSMNMLWKKRKI